MPAPIPFCTCASCAAMRAAGGPSLRKRAAALVNDDLLLDLGPDIEAASLIHGIPLSGVRYCLQTHPHADHCDPGHLLSRSPEYAVEGAPRLELYASAPTLAQLAVAFRAVYDERDLLEGSTQQSLNLRLHPITAWHPCEVGAYRVVPIPANHAAEFEALLFALASEGRAMLYATDTAALPDSTWEGLKRLEMRFNFAVLDHTYGPGLPGGDHLCAEQVAEHAERLRREGLMAPQGRVLATHVSHEGNPPHEELCAHAAARGYEIAYDGMVLEA